MFIHFTDRALYLLELLLHPYKHQQKRSAVRAYIVPSIFFIPDLVVSFLCRTQTKPARPQAIARSK